MKGFKEGKACTDFKDRASEHPDVRLEARTSLKESASPEAGNFAAFLAGRSIGRSH